MQKLERTNEFLGNRGALFKDDKKIIELRNVSIVRCNEIMISSGMPPVCLTSKSEVSFDPIDDREYYQLNDIFSGTPAIPHYILIVFGRNHAGIIKMGKINQFVFRSSATGEGHPAEYTDSPE